MPVLRAGALCVLRWAVESDPDGPVQEVGSICAESKDKVDFTEPRRCCVNVKTDIGTSNSGSQQPQVSLAATEPCPRNLEQGADACNGRAGHRTTRS